MSVYAKLSRFEIVPACVKPVLFSDFFYKDFLLFFVYKLQKIATRLVLLA
jgi:hypothetical protein